MKTSHGTSSNGAQVGSAHVLVVAGRDDRAVPFASTAICAEPSTCPAGWNDTSTLAELDASRHSATACVGAGEILAVAQPHDVERFLRRQHRAMAGARMVGMAMRDQRLLDRPGRIDMEAAALAAHAGRGRQQDVFGAHGLRYVISAALLTREARVTALFITSGDLIADRRYEFARGYAARGDLAAAADLYAAGDGTRAGLRVGVVRAGRNARGAWASAGAPSRLSDARRRPIRMTGHGARMRLASLGAADPATADLHAYVRTLFDQYAPRFDRALGGSGTIARPRCCTMR